MSSDDRASADPDRGRPRPADAIDRLRAAAEADRDATTRAAAAAFRDLWDVTPQLQLDLDLRLDGYARQPAYAVASRRRPLHAGRGRPDDAEGERRAVRRPPAARRAGVRPVSSAARSIVRPRDRRAALVHTYAPSRARSSCRAPTASRWRSSARSARGSRCRRRSARATARDLPTVMVGRDGGDAVLASAGDSVYREFQISVRQAWNAGRAAVRQLRARVVARSSRTTSARCSQTSTRRCSSRTTPSPPRIADVPHRLRAWATFALPHRVVDLAGGRVAQRLSVFDPGHVPALRRRLQHRAAAGATSRWTSRRSRPSTSSPARWTSALQVFNLTNHFNPRDVISVIDSPRFRELTNNPGVTFGGYMQVRW